MVFPFIFKENYKSISSKRTMFSFKFKKLIFGGLEKNGVFAKSKEKLWPWWVQKEWFTFQFKKFNVWGFEKSYVHVPSKTIYDLSEFKKYLVYINVPKFFELEKNGVVVQSKEK